MIYLVFSYNYTQLLKYWKTRLAEDYQLESFQQELHAVV